jgi:GT2 family glycosyltransferase
VPNPTTVSVVTPTLNQAAFLEWTLASVRAQSHASIEHIVMDGGSTDETVSILDREGARGTLTWVSEPDRGMYDAINKGLARARGDILTYICSDDAWFPWAVETVVAVFASRPDVDLVYGDGIKVRDGGWQRLRLFGPLDRISLANFESLMQPAVFWRRRLLDRIGGFDDSMRFVADLDYWLRAAAAGATIEHVDEVIAVERIHGARLSAAQKDTMAEEDRRMRARHAADQGGPEARARAVQREERWQRWLWLRFVLARAVSPLGGWRRFTWSGAVDVRWNRVVNGSEPGAQHTPLWGAVTSARAAEILGIASAAPRSARPLRAIRARLALLRHVIPHLMPARRAIRAVPTDEPLRSLPGAS